MSKLFVSRRTRAAAWVILLALPVLMVGFAYFHSHRPTVNTVGNRTFWDYIILNSDLLIGLVFLLVSSVPFFLVFDRKKPQARELVPIAVMAAIAVVGRTVFEIVPLPNFKPCSAVIIITAVSFGPEAGFLTGALTALVSNFIFGQGPWTPWQMFTWGLVGFLAGLLFGAFAGLCLLVGAFLGEFCLVGGGAVAAAGGEFVAVGEAGEWINRSFSNLSEAAG